MSQEDLVDLRPKNIPQSGDSSQPSQNTDTHQNSAAKKNPNHPVRPHSERKRFHSRNNNNYHHHHNMSSHNHPRSHHKPDAQNQSLEEYVENIFEKQKRLESRSRYREASRFKGQLEFLKQSIQKRNQKLLAKKHGQECRELEKAHALELKDMERVWLDIVDRYERKCNQMVGGWNRKRENDLKQLQQAMDYVRREAKIHSKDLVHIRNTEKKLANMEQYEEAEKLHKQLRQFQKEAQQRCMQEVEGRCGFMAQQLRKQHEKEHEVLKQRIESGRQEQQLLYRKQLQKVQLKYENVMKQLDKQHRADMQKIQRYNKSQNVLGLSRLNASWIMNNSQV